MAFVISCINLNAQCPGGPADLSLIKTASTLTPDSAEVFTFTITVTNNGPCDATGVELKDSMPSPLQYNGLPTGPGTFSFVGLTMPFRAILRWQNVTIPANTTATFSFRASSTASGSHGNFPFYMPNYAQIFTSNQSDPNSTPGNGYSGEDDDDDEIPILREGFCTVAGNTTPAPPNVTITNSSCGGGCIPSAGSFTAPAGTPCTSFPYNSFYAYTLQYQVDGGPWTSTLPTYDQDGPPQTVKTRCNCNYNNFFSSDESAPVTTAPIVCSPPSCTITGDALVCSGSTNSYSAPSGMNTYSWSISGDAMISGATNNQSVSVNANPTGSYTLTVTTTNGSSCSATCNLPVSITTTFTTVNDGNYNNPATWLSGCIPPNPLPMGGMVNIVNNIINPVGFTLTNNGTISLGTGGSFTNNGSYIGNGLLNGDMINNGTVSPGN